MCLIVLGSGSVLAFGGAARPRSSSGAVAGNPSPLLGTDYLVTLLASHFV